MLDFTQNLMHSQIKLQLPKTLESGLKVGKKQTIVEKRVSTLSVV